MKFHNLGTSSKPCGILRWRGLTIMIDCALDLSPVLNFIPLPLAGNSKFNNLPHFQNYQNPLEEELCEINGYLFVDSPPLFGVPSESSIDISEIDVILISNSSTILSLPFYTQNPRFTGTIYATEPTLTIGKFLMDELAEFVENTPKSSSSKSSSPSSEFPNGESSNIFKLLSPSLNFPFPLSASTPYWRELKEIYTKKSIGEALLKVKVVGYNEHTSIFGKVVVTAVSSGFSLGSCNWIFKGENKKIAYLSSSSTLTTHPSQMEQSPLKDSDLFILSCLNRAPTSVADHSLGEICATAASTLSAGGNVLFPSYPSGIIYDLFECLSVHLESQRLGTVPFVFIAPHAETSLAYSNILSEWLSVNKQRKVYIPEDPFPHTGMVKTNKLRHFKTLAQVTEFRQPSIVFCGHPSLRFGDIAHLIETWGNNSANTIIFTDTDLPYIECLIPFQPLAMKAIYCPIDPSLTFHQANKLLKDFKPKHLITHEEYLTPPKSHPTRADLVIDYPNMLPVEPGGIISLKLRRKSVKTFMDPKMAQEISPAYEGVSANGKEVFASTITTSLDNMDNKNRLVKPNMDLVDALQSPPQKYIWGELDGGLLNEKLGAEGFVSTIQYTRTGYIISIPSERATIQVDGFGTEIICKKNDLGAVRAKLRRIIVSCLTQF